MSEGRQMINDEGYFKQYPAPIFEASCKDHIDMPINHSTPYYGPLLYWLARCAGAFYVAEVGVCYGYTSYFLASAVRDNMTRQGMTGEESGHYYGIDISGRTVELQEKLRAKGLPVSMIQKDSFDLVPQDFATNSFGLVFIDGWHSEQHLRKELDFFYPMVHGSGRGYIVIHDCYGWVFEPMQKILKDPKYNFEYIRFYDNYGLAILRKMDGYTEDVQRIWPNGPQPDIRNEDGSVKEI